MQTCRGAIELLLLKYYSNIIRVEHKEEDLPDPLKTEKCLTIFKILVKQFQVFFEKTLKLTQK